VQPLLYVPPQLLGLYCAVVLTATGLRWAAQLCLLVQLRSLARLRLNAVPLVISQLPLLAAQLLSPVKQRCALEGAQGSLEHAKALCERPSSESRP
jgi:hypothetical protein